MEQANGRVTVLTVDDDVVCHMLVERALEDIQSTVRVAAASDGLEALEALRSADPATSVRRPYVVLLDLRMPQMSGLEFLEEVRKDPNLHDAIVFVLTTSKQEEDIKTAFQFNVAGYLVKSMEYAKFKEVIAMLDQYCRVTAFPPRIDKRNAMIEAAKNAH